MALEWNECTLGDLITFQRGHDLPKTKMNGGEYPVVGSNGIIGWHNEYTTEAPSVTIGRSGNVGNPFLFEGRSWSHNTTLYIKEYKNADPVFMYYFLKTLDLGNYAGGSAVPTLNRNHIHSLHVRVPDIKTQKKIAYILNLFDKKIESNNKTNKLLKEVAMSVFTDWFIDYTHFDDLLVETPAGFKVPQSLKMVQIADIPHTLETGRRPKGGAVSEGIPSIGAEDVKNLGEVNFSSTKYIPKEFAAKMKTGRVDGYEVMIYKDGGKPGTFTPHFSMFGEGFPYELFYINEHVFKLDFFDRGYNEFAYLYFNTEYPYNWLASNGGKAAIPGINQSDVNSIWIFAPDNYYVKKFCIWVQPIFTTILKNCNQNVKLTSAKDTLLQKIMVEDIDLTGIII